LAAKDAEERKLLAELLKDTRNELISFNNVLNTLLQPQNTTPGTHLPAVAAEDCSNVLRRSVLYSITLLRRCLVMLIIFLSQMQCWRL